VTGQQGEPAEERDTPGAGATEDDPPGRDRPGAGATEDDPAWAGGPLARDPPPPRVTLRDVARAAGVSHTTVSNAYRRPDRLSAAVRRRVLETARSLGYPGPDPVAAGLRTRRVGALGVLFTEELAYAFTDPAAVLFLQGVAAVGALADVGLTLLPAPPRAGDADASRTRQAVARAVVDGYLVYSVSDRHPGLLAAEARGLPLVVVDEPEPGPEARWPYLGVDDRAGARRAAEHLAGLGHRRVAVLADRLAADAVRGLAGEERRRQASFAVGRNRLAGYLEGLARHGLGGADVPVYECGGNLAGLGRDGADALLGLSPDRRPTAILAMTDQLARGALQAARARGLAVPDALSVVGFDDIPAAAEADPPLTTVRQPLHDKGRRAAELLLALLRDPAAVAPGPHDLLPVELVARGSTAPPPPPG
jgi:DNA-binding LacI/PurR family transcriptional regulator